MANPCFRGVCCLDAIFESEKELITEAANRQAVLLDRVVEWEDLHNCLTQSSCSLTDLYIGDWSSEWHRLDWNKVCSTLGSPDLRLRSVFFGSDVAPTHEDLATLAAFIRSHTDHEKLHLRNVGFAIHDMSGWDGIAEAFQGSDCQLEGFSLTSYDDRDHTWGVGDKLAQGFAKALTEAKCNLRCLSLSCQISDDGATSLFEALRSNGCKLSELDMTLLQPMALRPLAEALQDASCQLQRLALQFHVVADEDVSIFANALLSENCKLVEVKFYCEEDFSKTAEACIAQTLRSSRCKLEALAMYGFGKTPPQLLVNALEENLRLISLDLYNLSDALRVRTDALLARNRLLREGELLDHPQVKPHTAKLFICGHEQVGKTTVRKSLRRAKRPIPTVNPLDYLRQEPRTRGMELENLSFGDNRHIVMCDLGGQREYHAFHHYFVTGSDKDLFLIVCKHAESTSQKEFELQLQYWLRFIVSHRTPGMSKPKVVILVNFFNSRDTKESLTRNAEERTRPILEQCKSDLDFGTTEESSVFGINAKVVPHVTPLLGKLDVLLQQLLDSRPEIPDICDELSRVITGHANKFKLFWQSVRHPKYAGKEKSPYLTFGLIVTKYMKQFHKNASTKTFRAALVELHNSGQIVYFQPDNEHDKEIVIADSGWFCHNLIGALLEPQGLRRSPQSGETWMWHEQDVLDILRKQRHENEQQLVQVLRYLQQLELFYPLCEEDKDGCSMPSKQLLFPALLTGTKAVNWPDKFLEESAVFFGRRLECKNKHKTLLPLGVFARLQVRLHSLYGENRSYGVGPGWISFVEDCVVIIVRFAGETDHWEDRHWIDMMLSYPKSCEEHETTAEKILRKVKFQIFEICLGGDRGCPSVALDESAMKEEDVKQLKPSASTEVVLLETLKGKILTKGITYSYSWRDRSYTTIEDLLLPRELEDLARQDGRAVCRIAEEFQLEKEDWWLSMKQGENLSLEGPSTGVPLSGELEALWQRILGSHQRMDARNEERYLNIVEGLTHIRKEIRSLAKRFEQVEKSIFSSCANQLLKELQLLRDYQKGPLPAFLYFTNKHGVWHKMKGLLGKEVQLHIMCEWHGGPHPVENQPGVPAMISTREWLVRIAPVLIPALKLFCCAARLAASIYLPGTQVFIPSTKWLEAFGLSGEMIQHQILPAVLETFVDEVSKLEDIKAAQLDLNEPKLRELLVSLLKMKGKNICMERDFNLHRVEFADKGRIHWVCEDHCRGEKLPNINPFL